MAGPNQKWMFHSFQPVPPLLQLQLDHQKFPVTYIVVSLSGVETIGQEGTGMELLVLGRSLGQNGPHSNVRSIDLNHKLTGRVQMDEDGSHSEPALQVHKGCVNSGRPCEWYFGRGECREVSRQGTVAANETAVEVSQGNIEANLPLLSPFQNPFGHFHPR